MAYHQNSTVDTTKLIIGNCKIETAPSAGDTFVNLGAGRVSNFNHNITQYDVQAGNAPDPIEGIADETVTIDFEMIEYDASVLAAISCGAVTSTSTTAMSTLEAGGNSTLTPRAYRLTNTRLISGATKQTILTVLYGTLSTGFQFSFKDDEDADPVGVIAASILGKVDSSLTAGSQLYTITRDLVE
jgi:hypothetical protein